MMQYIAESFEHVSLQNQGSALLQLGPARKLTHISFVGSRMSEAFHNATLTYLHITMEPILECGGAGRRRF